MERHTVNYDMSDYGTEIIGRNSLVVSIYIYMWYVYEHESRIVKTVDITIF